VELFFSIYRQGCISPKLLQRRYLSTSPVTNIFQGISRILDAAARGFREFAADAASFDDYIQSQKNVTKYSEQNHKMKNKRMWGKK
jgi:hypothetical protein